MKGLRMKKYISYIVVTSLLSGVSSVKAVLNCNPVPTTVEEAKACAKGLLEKQTEIQALLENNKHIGDMGTCQKTQPTPIPSFFSNNGIANVLKNVTLGDCEVHENNEYRCYVNLYQNACNISPNGTSSKTKIAVMRIENVGGNLVDFYPVFKESK